MVYRTIGWLCAAAGVGCAAAMAVFYQFLQPLAAYPRQKYTLLVGLTVLFAWLAWGQVNRFLRPRLAEFSLPKRLLWIVTAAAAGVLLLWAIPIPPAPVRSAHSVKIVATGKKSAASQGSEVWVYGLFAPDGQCVVPATEFSKEGDWEVRDGALVSCRSQPATLAWEGLGARDLQLRVLSHPGSGIAKVAWNGGEQEVNLCSTPGMPKTITPTAPPPERTLGKALALARLGGDRPRGVLSLARLVLFRPSGGTPSDPSATILTATESAFSPSNTASTRRRGQLAD